MYFLIIDCVLNGNKKLKFKWLTDRDTKRNLMEQFEENMELLNILEPLGESIDPVSTDWNDNIDFKTVEQNMFVLILKSTMFTKMDDLNIFKKYYLLFLLTNWSWLDSNLFQSKLNHSSLVFSELKSFEFYFFRT